MTAKIIKRKRRSEKLTDRIKLQNDKQGKQFNTENEASAVRSIYFRNTRPSMLSKGGYRLTAKYKFEGKDLRYEDCKFQRIYSLQ